MLLQAGVFYIYFMLWQNILTTVLTTEGAAKGVFLPFFMAFCGIVGKRKTLDFSRVFFGEPGGIRTHDLLIRSQTF